jgi:CheY-like chemotaxis protein
MENKPARQLLIVDDDAEYMFMIQQFLFAPGRAAWKVHMAENCATALNILKTNAVDLIMLDVRLPVMDGLQFLTLLKQTHPGIPVVIVTAFGTEEDRAYSLQNGAALFVDKITVVEAFEKIYAALEKLASTASQGFRGMLRQVGLPEVIQMECLARKSSILEISGHDTSGRIYICDGSLVHAEVGGLVGEPALFKLLGLGGGEFHVRPFAKPPKHTIDGSWESLLMESARLRDEAVHAAASVVVDPASGGLSAGNAELSILSEATAPPMERPAEHVPDMASPSLPQPGTLVAPEMAAPAVAAQEIPLPQAPPLPPNRRIEEVVLCAGTGEVLFESPAKCAEARSELLDLLTAKSSTLGKLLPLGRADRIEIYAGDDRVMVLLQADRKAFVRSTLTSLAESEVPRQ